MVGHSGERFDREMKSIHHLGEDWLVTLENVSTGNEEYSSFGRRLVGQSGEHFDREMKSIHHLGEDWLVTLENVSTGK